MSSYISGYKSSTRQRTLTVPLCLTQHPLQSVLNEVFGPDPLFVLRIIHPLLRKWYWFFPGMFAMPLKPGETLGALRVHSESTRCWQGSGLDVGGSHYSYSLRLTQVKFPLENGWISAWALAWKTLARAGPDCGGIIFFHESSVGLLPETGCT